MKIIPKTLSVIAFISLMSCGGKGKEATDVGSSDSEKESVVDAAANTPEPDVTGMDNKGIGPVKNIAIPGTIDQAMADQGQEIYKTKCTACHKVDQKFIGPSPLGILERRSPEWVMNMILNPEEMIQKDPIAKQLLAEYNGAPMANQGLTEEDARKVLEYFRTLK